MPGTYPGQTRHTHPERAPDRDVSRPNAENVRCELSGEGSGNEQYARHSPKVLA